MSSWLPKNCVYVLEKSKSIRIGDERRIDFLRVIFFRDFLIDIFFAFLSAALFSADRTNHALFHSSFCSVIWHIHLTVNHYEYARITHIVFSWLPNLFQFAMVGVSKNSINFSLMLHTHTYTGFEYFANQSCNFWNVHKRQWKQQHTRTPRSFL